MVIAQVLSSFSMGGQEVMAAELARRQVAQGHRVVAVSLAPAVANPVGDVEATFASAGVTRLHVPRLGPRFDPTLPFRLAMAFRRHSVQIAHLHNHLPLIYGAPAAKLAGCTVVATRHGLVEGGGRQLWLRRQIIHFVDAYVAVSSHVAENTRAHRLAFEPKLTVIENGIDLDRYRPRLDLRAAVRAELGLALGQLAIGSVSRLDQDKNTARLLRAALPHLGPTRQLLIVGDGPERPTLESLAGSHPRGGFIRFLGQRDDVPRLLNGLDLFALSSRTEGHPLAVIEAMATGLPVLATEVGGIPEMVQDGTTGFLSADEESAFASRLALALEQSPRWPDMGAAARAFAGARFSSARMADGYLGLYQRIRRRAA